MAKLKRAVVLEHQVSVNAAAEKVSFEAGRELTVLKEWSERVLCKDASGRMFNVPKELLEL